MPHKNKRERKYAASYRADRMDALNEQQDAGGDAGAAARQQKAKMRDTWQRRQSNNVTGFHAPASRPYKDAGSVKAVPKLGAMPGKGAVRVA